MATSPTPPPPADYVKHILECKCILPQYRNMDMPVFHKFLAFSVLDASGMVIPSYAQCNNCGVIHKVLEVGKSTLMRKEDMPSLITTEDLRVSLPPKLVGLLELHDCPLATWQEADFILKHKLWGRGFALVKELDGSTLVGKYVQVIGEELYNVQSFEREEGLV